MTRLRGWLGVRYWWDWLMVAGIVGASAVVGYEFYDSHWVTRLWLVSALLFGAGWMIDRKRRSQ